MQRADGQDLAEALEDINARLLAAVTPLQREIFQTSTLDESLLAERGEGAPRAADRLSRGAFARSLPAAAWSGRGDVGLGHLDLPPLPASLQVRARAADPHRADRAPALRDRRAPGARALPRRRRHHARGTARAARRRAGAVRVSAARGATASCWTRRAPRSAPTTRACTGRTPSRSGSSAASPSTSGRTSSAGASTASIGSRRGGEAEYELIDYKTSRPKSAEQLARRRAALALRARRARGLAAGLLAAGLLLRARRPPRARAPRRARRDSGRATSCSRSARASSRQDFEPTPSHAACSICDYRIVCPAAEA